LKENQSVDTSLMFATIPLQKTALHSVKVNDHCQWRNWRGRRGARRTPAKLNVKNGTPLRDFVNFRTWKWFYRFWNPLVL